MDTPPVLLLITLIGIQSENPSKIANLLSKEQIRFMN